jgi:hypothetical protein
MASTAILPHPHEHQLNLTKIPPTVKVTVAIVGASGETGRSIVNGLLADPDTEFVGLSFPPLPLTIHYNGRILAGNHLFDATSVTQ